MALPFPQSDLPTGIRGGSSAWDDPQASVVLSDDYFPAPVQGGSTLKYWSGSAWVDKPLKRWNGSAWVSATLKRWNGSAWVVK